MPTDLTLRAADGRNLAATLYPATPTNDAAGPPPGVLIAGATGVARRFYAGFAADLASTGATGTTVLTLDYRGLAGSRDRPVRRDPATLDEWGALDLDAGLRRLRQEIGDRPIGVVGHSAGGWLLGLAPSAAEVRAMLTVASQVGDWRAWPAPRRYLLWLFWHLVLPGAVAAFGYLPRFILGGEHLPAGVARQWAAWGRRPTFLAGTAAHHNARGYDALSGPLRAYAIAGDLFAPVNAVARFPALYPNTSSEIRLIDQSGSRPFAATTNGPVDRIGQPAETALPTRPDHFGVFRPTFRDTLWSEWSGWMSAQLS